MPRDPGSYLPVYAARLPRAMVISSEPQAVGLMPILHPESGLMNLMVENSLAEYPQGCCRGIYLQTGKLSFTITCFSPWLTLVDTAMRRLTIVPFCLQCWLPLGIHLPTQGSVRALKPSNHARISGWRDPDQEFHSEERGSSEILSQPERETFATGSAAHFH